MTDVPPVVRNEVIALGAEARLDGLPSLVAGLEGEWGVAVGGAYRDATEAFVTDATLADGTPAVLTLLVPRSADAARHEITVLRLVGSEGVREDPVEVLAGGPMDRARSLAARTGLDADAISEWGVVERISTELLGVQVGLEPVAREMLHAADVVAR